MDEILKANIFFLITGSAVIILSLIGAAVLVYVVFILRTMRGILDDVKDITGKARTEAEALAEDLGDLRSKVKTDGAKLTHFITFFGNLISRRRIMGKRSKRSSKDE